MRKINKKAQSTLEYAVLIAVVVAAFLAMNIYMKRGVQGKLRESSDRIGEQYSAGETTSKYTTTQMGPRETRDRFGGELGIGVSRHDVEQAPMIETKAEGADAERIQKRLDEEDLFWRPQ